MLPMKHVTSIDGGRLTFLNKEEEVSTLNIRGQKKEKKNIKVENFDEIWIINKLQILLLL